MLRIKMPASTVNTTHQKMHSNSFEVIDFPIPEYAKFCKRTTHLLFGLFYQHPHWQTPN